jgi:preprotein translocase subunit SecB
LFRLSARARVTKPRHFSFKNDRHVACKFPAIRGSGERQLAINENLTTESREMADEPKSQNGDGTASASAAVTPGATPDAAPPAPQIPMISQYIKDLSFENPGVGRQVKSPKVELAVDLQAHRATEPSQYEVVLKLRVTATDETATMFIVELAYGAYAVLKDVPEEVLQQILMIEIPRQIFPFARRIVADVTRDGGMMPLMLEPIDFLAIYQKKMAETAGQAPPVS